MSLPRTNQTTTENVPWVNGATAAASFTTSVPMLMDSRAAVEIIYSGLDAADAYVRLRASNSNDVTRSRILEDSLVTMTTANSSIMFNIWDVGYSYLHLEYDAGSNSAGTITAHLSRKHT